MAEVRLPCFRPTYQFLFTVLHLFREAWLQKFVDFGSDVGLMKFGDVIRLVDRDRDELTDGELLRIMETHNVTRSRRLGAPSSRRDLPYGHAGTARDLKNMVTRNCWPSKCNPAHTWALGANRCASACKVRPAVPHDPRRRHIRSLRMSRIKSLLFRRGDMNGIDCFFPHRMKGIKSLLFQLVPTRYRARKYQSTTASGRSTSVRMAH